jgi:hypothetical protein
VRHRAVVEQAAEALVSPPAISLRLRSRSQSRGVLSEHGDHSAVVVSGGGDGSVGSVVDQPQFIIWAVRGWTASSASWWARSDCWALPRLDSAGTYALGAGIVFAVVAVWGFIDGNNVFSLLAGDTTTDITRAIVAALGLLTGTLPRGGRRAQKSAAVSGAERFSRASESTPSRGGQTAGHR